MLVRNFGANFLFTGALPCGPGRFGSKLDMADSTPSSDKLEYGQLNVETLDDVAPRLRRFTEELLTRLRGCKLDVTTATVYLLNSTEHPIEVPALANGVQIQMNFDATLPIWAPEPRARLQVSFNEGRRYFYAEVGQQVRNAKFPMRKVLARFLHEIHILARQQRIKTDKERKLTQAQQRLAALGQTLGIPVTPGSQVLRTGNLKIRALDKTPTLALVLLVVPYEQAAEIAKKYLKP